MNMHVIDGGYHGRADELQVCQRVQSGSWSYCPAVQASNAVMLMLGQPGIFAGLSITNLPAPELHHESRLLCQRMTLDHCVSGEYRLP